MWREMRRPGYALKRRGFREHLPRKLFSDSLCAVAFELSAKNSYPMVQNERAVSTSRTTIMKAINTVICSRGVTCETTLLKPTMLPAPGSSHVVINNSNNSSLSKTIKFRQSSTSKILFKRLPILERRIFYSGSTCICYAKFLRFLSSGRSIYLLIN